MISSKPSSKASEARLPCFPISLSGNLKIYELDWLTTEKIGVIGCYVGKNNFRESLECKLSEIGRITPKLESFGEENAIAPKAMQQVILVIDELLTNTINYAFTDPTTAKISISVICTTSRLEVLLEDNGITFDPLHEAVKPDLAASIEDRKIGGLGVHIAKRMMDNIDYHRVGDTNQLRFFKNIGDV